MDGYAFSSCDLARLAEVDGLNPAMDERELPSEELIRQNIIQVLHFFGDELCVKFGFVCMPLFLCVPSPFPEGYV